MTLDQLPGGAQVSVGAGVFHTQLLGLLLGRLVERARKQSVHGRHRHVFHLFEIDAQSRPVLSPVLPDDNFSPLLANS